MGTRANIIFFSIAATTLPAVAQDVKNSVEPPIVGRYEGSFIKEQTVNAFDRVAMAIKGLPNDKFETITVEGKRTLTALQGPRGRSSLEIFTNYANALNGAGFSTVFRCSREQCPRTLFVNGLGSDYSAGMSKMLSLYGDGSTTDGHYIVARRKIPSGDEYIRIAVRGNLPVAAIDVVQPAAMETRVKVVEAAGIKGDIARRGKAVLYAIFFDFDRAELKPDSKTQLEELAKYLRTDPAVNIFVVGHTDGKGKVEYNNDLSRRRAAAVVAALVGDYKIRAARLSAHGTGPLAPVSTNETEDGRALNRRVEIVKRLE